MKILLIGEGRIGSRFIEKYQDYIIKHYPNSDNIDSDLKVDIVIDFSNRNNIKNILDYCLFNKTPLLIGTTGFNKQDIGLIENASKTIPILLEANYSNGIHLLKRLIKESLKENYKDIYLREVHHVNKLDSISGTALDLLKYINAISSTEVTVSSKREGNNLGSHSVVFSNENEEISITHKVKNIDVFIDNSFSCAEKLITKEPGLYNYENVYKNTSQFKLFNSKKYSDTLIIFSYQGFIDKLGLTIIGNKDISFINDDLSKINRFLEVNKNNIISYKLYPLSINQALPLYNYQEKKYRIEPGAIIREGVEIKEGAIVLMNSTINVGAHIGRNTMIDMNAVIGSNAVIKDNCHIGASAVISGVLEPHSDKPVVIENNCFIGASSVILEGVHIGENSIVGALSLVTKDVPANSLVMGIPARVIKTVDENVKNKCEINPLLR